MYAISKTKQPPSQHEKYNNPEDGKDKIIEVIKEHVL